MTHTTPLWLENASDDLKIMHRVVQENYDIIDHKNTRSETRIVLPTHIDSLKNLLFGIKLTHQFLPGVLSA